jgi:hypothetical protein
MTRYLVPIEVGSHLMRYEVIFTTLARLLNRWYGASWPYFNAV